LEFIGVSNSNANSGRPRAGKSALPRPGEPDQPATPIRVYQLYVRRDGAWSWVCTFDAPSHAEAFRRVLLCLRGDEFERPIRLEQDTEGTFRKPCDRHCGGADAAELSAE
jgi:hypothetical protein